MSSFHCQDRFSQSVDSQARDHGRDFFRLLSRFEPMRDRSGWAQVHRRLYYDDLNTITTDPPGTSTSCPDSTSPKSTPPTSRLPSNPLGILNTPDVFSGVVTCTSRLPVPSPTDHLTPNHPKPVSNPPSARSSPLKCGARAHVVPCGAVI
ncbi:hypothetical protein E4T56_gene17906 [Termitomyces sp. T112]|nr:hypothetical protein E4T56_gene17906 [Termitomyces sp. T112]